MEGFKQAEGITLRTVAIRIKNREKMLHFYRDVLGFALKREENELAILGTVAHKDETLWLEETPYAEEHFGEIKKLQRLSLVIPTVAELGDILMRIEKNNYPLTDALYEDGIMGILITDPEENQIELIYGDSKGHAVKAPEALDPVKLKAQATGEFPQLSEGVTFDKVHLNTSEMAREQRFLEQILGLTIKDEADGIHVLNEGNFHVGLKAGTGGTLDLSADRVLGLDFLKFGISQDGLLAMESHLKSVGSEFYIDKKKSILTIYDPAGIEWWFKVV